MSTCSTPSKAGDKPTETYGLRATSCTVSSKACLLTFFEAVSVRHLVTIGYLSIMWGWVKTYDITMYYHIWGNHHPLTSYDFGYEISHSILTSFDLIHPTWLNISPCTIISMVDRSSP